MLRIARTRLPRLAARFGPYGWPDLQIVVTDDAAMEHTGLIMTPPQDFVVTHELAHLWWYALISGDQAKAPWLDESFASYAEEAAGAQRRPWCRSPRRGAFLVTKPVDFFRGERLGAYGFVYSEGACLLDLLRKRMGAARFDAALRDYALAHRHGWSTGAAFRAAMDAASPVPLDRPLAPLPGVLTQDVRRTGGRVRARSRRRSPARRTRRSCRAARWRASRPSPGRGARAGRAARLADRCDPDQVRRRVAGPDGPAEVAVPDRGARAPVKPRRPRPGA